MYEMINSRMEQIPYEDMSIDELKTEFKAKIRRLKQAQENHEFEYSYLLLEELREIKKHLKIKRRFLKKDRDKEVVVDDF